MALDKPAPTVAIVVMTATETKRGNNVTFKNIPLGGKVIAAATNIRPFTDPHLGIVLAELDGQYATWIVNTETWGYSHGHYFPFNQPDSKDGFREIREKAYLDFTNRLLTAI